MRTRLEKDVGSERLVRMGKGMILLLLFGLLLLVLSKPIAPAWSADCDCGYCHGDNHHGEGWTGCSGCHDSPPQTGTHLTHYNSAPLPALSYGDTTVSSTAEAYKFGCGNCHPLDSANHNNGQVNVELYNTSSPAGSIKSMNPSNAAYTQGATVTTYPSKLSGGRSLSWTDGTCSNVYCHSGYTITSGPVGNPLTYPENPLNPGYMLNTVNNLTYYIMDETCSNLTYAPYTVNYQRVYAATPAWGAQWSTKSLKFSSQTADFTVGHVVRGATSLAEGMIVSQSDGGSFGLLNLSGVSGTFLSGETITEVGGTGSATVDRRVEIRYGSQTSDFRTTEIVTGQTSGATATIFYDSDAGATGVLSLAGATANFIPGEIITGATRGSAVVVLAETGPAVSEVCTQCHQFPLLTDYTTVSAGVGDSHMWMNEYGYMYGHANNMEYFRGLPCRTCHYDTVTAIGNSFRISYVEIYDPVALASRAMHVNGSADVKFDTTNNYRYFNYWGYCSPPNWDPSCPIDNLYSLQAGTYNPDTKTCNVSCHYNPAGPSPKWQQNVKWGSPYRGWEGPTQECDQCHRGGYLNESCTMPQ